MNVNMTTFEKLQKRIKEELGLDLVEFGRCYPGYWQRAQGAWSWGARYNISGTKWIGSQWSATKCLKAKRLAHYIPPDFLMISEEIIPEDK